MKSMNFLKGMGAGVMVGAALGVMMGMDKKTGRKRLGKMLRTAGDVIEDLGGVLGL